MYTFGAIGAGGHMLDGHVIPGATVDLRMAAVYDPKFENASTLAAHPAAAPAAVPTTSMDRFLETNQVNAYVIASPDEFHARQLLDTVQFLVEHRRRTPILVDKPLAITKQDLELVRVAFRLAQNDGIPITSCLVRHFDPPYAWLVDNLGMIMERLGSLRHIEMVFDYPKPSASWKLEGRSLMYDHAIHELYVLLVMLFPGCKVDIRLVDDGPTIYKMKGSIGYDGTKITFTCKGYRMRERPEHTEERGLFAETIHLIGTHGRCLVDTAFGDASIYVHDGPFKERSGKTDYDARLQGVMANLRSVIEGAAPYVSTKELLRLTEMAVDLESEGAYGIR